MVSTRNMRRKNHILTAVTVGIESVAAELATHSTGHGKTPGRLKISHHKAEVLSGQPGIGEATATTSESLLLRIRTGFS